MTLYLALRGYDTHIWTHTHVAAQTKNTNSIPFTSNLLCRFELSSLSVRYGCNAVKILIRLHKLAVVQHANSLLTVQSALDGASEKNTPVFRLPMLRRCAVAKAHMELVSATVSRSKPQKPPRTSWSEIRFLSDCSANSDSSPYQIRWSFTVRALIIHCLDFLNCAHTDLTAGSDHNCYHRTTRKAEKLCFWIYVFKGNFIVVKSMDSSGFW